MIIKLTFVRCGHLRDCRQFPFISVVTLHHRTAQMVKGNRYSFSSCRFQYISTFPKLAMVHTLLKPVKISLKVTTFYFFPLRFYTLSAVIREMSLVYLSTQGTAGHVIRCNMTYRIPSSKTPITYTVKYLHLL